MPDLKPPRRDRIFLGEHVRDIEIGVFDEEFGVVQRVRFNVALEVAPFADHAPDEPTEIVSYDLIVEAIETVATGPRIKLLETFAARLASRLLAHPGVYAADLKLEKLDRVSGALGVEIRREKQV